MGNNAKVATVKKTNIKLKACLHLCPEQDQWQPDPPSPDTTNTLKSDHLHHLKQWANRTEYWLPHFWLADWQGNGAQFCLRPCWSNISNRELPLPPPPTHPKLCMSCCHWRLDNIAVTDALTMSVGAQGAACCSTKWTQHRRFSNRSRHWSF